jgi:putative ABC transport system ATP-binding protein
MAPASLEVTDLVVEFGSAGYRIRPLDGLSMSAVDGELVVLLGPSGCGKTTLLSCLAGLLTPSEGGIRFGDTEVTKLQGQSLTDYRRSTVGIVFQAFNLVRSLTARENVMAPMLLSGARRRDAGLRADVLLEEVALAERARHRPSDLSGGQQQRVAIARALVHEPPLLLADEPTAHLDHIQVEGILKLLRDLAVPGRLVLVSTHDDRVTRLADRVIELAPRGQEAMATEPVPVELASGETLFRQGDYGDLVYVVEAGEIELYREREDGTEELIGRMRRGQYFGEIAPLLTMPRTSSARAVGAGRVVGYPLNLFSRRFPSIMAALQEEGHRQAQGRETMTIAAMQEPRVQTMTINAITERPAPDGANGCAKGHTTPPLPPGIARDLVRLSCGCPLATASDAALIEEFGRVLAPHEREERIRAAARAST